MLAAVQPARRPAVVHGGPAFPGLGRVSAATAARLALSVGRLGRGTRPAVVSQPPSRVRVTG